MNNIINKFKVLTNFELNIFFKLIIGNKVYLFKYSVESCQLLLYLSLVLKNVQRYGFHLFFT